jgi:scaffold protein (connect acetoacetyl-CoA thiolase and HMG-CoA synthase)
MSEEMITVDKYFAHLKDGKLMGSKCAECGNVDLPPRRLCSKCLKEAAWLELSGKGKVKTFTAVYVGVPAMEQKGYNRKHPYIFSIVKVEEGPMVSGQLIEVNEDDPSSIAFDLDVQATFLKTEISKDKEGNPVYRWDVGFKPA